jgi:hypothetical protein
MRSVKVKEPAVRQAYDDLTGFARHVAKVDDGGNLSAVLKVHG